MAKPKPKAKLPATYKGKSTKPGGGGRWAMKEEAMMREGMPKAKADRILAAQGNAEYGKPQMQAWAKAGRKRAARKRAMKGT